MELRLYQRDLVNNIRTAINRGNQRVCAVLGCGGGKSVIIATIAKASTDNGARVLFLVHRRELVEQIKRTMHRQGVDPDLCSVMMVQTASRRLRSLAPPVLIIVDECFVAGTLVDGVPIENIRPGDCVRSFDEKTRRIKPKRVTKVFKNPIGNALVRLIINGKKTVCTPNHPFFVVPGIWKEAGALKKGDCVYVCMPKMRGTHEKFAGESPSVHSLLQKRNGRAKPEDGFRKDETSQPNEESGSKREDAENIKADRPQTLYTRRKWNRGYHSTETTGQSFGMANGGGRCNKNAQSGVSALLQGRHSQQGTKDRNRSGRRFSWGAAGEDGGRKENQLFEIARVESAEIYKRSSLERFKKVCGNGYVYNLEVEGNHTYFANGVAVHNCHHILSRTYQKIIEYFPKALVVGFTATPQRMGEGGLGKVFQQLITSVSTKWLIENHYLAPYHLYSAPLADPKGLHTRNGDYAPEEVAELMEKGAIFGDTVKNWKHYADGKKTIVYCASIKSSKGTAAAFQAAGIPAEHLDGQTPTALRQKIVEDFRAGHVLVLCNVDLFGEGFDVPDCEAVCLLRPTKSLTLYIQQAMRPMRTDPGNPGKEAIILDHVGNYTRHGFPDDDREWSLKPKKRKKQAETSVTQCPVCFHVFKPAPTCPYCGYEFKAAKDSGGVDKERGQETVDGLTLEEIKESPYGDYKRCKTFAELEIFRKAKGYKFGWSLHKAAEMGLELPPKYRGVARKFSEGWFRRRKA
jgi:superfamily II DNA or RNA helicase